MQRTSRLLAVGLVVYGLPRGSTCSGSGGNAEAFGVPDGFGEPVKVQWADVTVSEALADLASGLGRPVWATQTVRRQSAQRRVHFVGRNLNGFQALSALCRIADMHWAYIENVVVLTAASETPSVLRLAACAARNRIYQAHPEWNHVRMGTSLANVDLFEASPGLAAERLSELFQVDLWMNDALRKSQALITIREQGMSATQAVSALARQLGAEVAQADGVYWLSPADGTSGSTTRPSGGTQPGRVLSGAWRVLRSGPVAAEGWAEDIEAIAAFARAAKGAVNSRPVGIPGDNE